MSKIVMQEVKVTRNYQITIPKVIAEKFGIKIGDKVIIIYEDGKIILNKKKSSIRNLAGRVKNLKITSRDLDKEIKEIIDSGIGNKK